MGNIVGCAFDNLEEGFTWLISLISQWIKSAFDTIKEACTWVISRLIEFFQTLSEWIESCLNQTRRFFDNLSEKIKDDLVKSKNMIDTTMKKAANIMSCIANRCHSSSQKVKLKNLATSLVENLKELFGYVKEYIDLVSEAAKKIGRRFKMPSEVGDLLFELCRIFLGERVGLVREKFDGFFRSNFKSLAKDERTRAMVVNICLTVLTCIIQIIAKIYVFGYVKEYIDLVSEAKKTSEVGDILFEVSQIFVAVCEGLVREKFDEFLKRNSKSLDERIRDMLVNKCLTALMKQFLVTTGGGVP